MKTVAIVLLALSCSVSLLVAQPLTKSDELFIDSLMKATYRPDQPGAVVLVAKEGKPLFRKAYGLASVELSVPNRPENVFAIGSMSKQFTAVCLLRLAQEGKLSLTDDVRKYDPLYNTHGRAITIAHLLTHTSGITSYTEKSDFATRVTNTYSKREMLDYFMSDSLLFEPGTDWSYSNSGFYLAACIVEKVTGVPFDEYLAKQIFEPIGMTHTFVGTSERIIPDLSAGYDAAGDSTFRPASYLNWSWPFGAGAILSNVDDMLKWDEALYSDRAVGREWLQKAWTDFVLADGRKANYGFGWALGEYGGMRIIRHGGAINGFLSDAFRIPSKQLYVIILSNTTAKSPSDAAASIAMRVAGHPLTVPPVINLTPEERVSYTGVYAVHRAGSRLASNMSDEKNYRYILVANDTLFQYRTGSSKSAMLNVGRSLFVLEESNTYFRFNRKPSGDISTVEIYNEPVNYGPNEIEPRTDLPLPEEREALTLDGKILSQYKGKYDFGGGFMIAVTVEGVRIFIQATGQERAEIFAESDTKFFLKVVDASIEFTKNESGAVSGMILNQGGKYPARKID
jgi:CubicO group peptidase (beta-lactamase class C family)